MIFFACVVCKATHCLLRLFNFGATSLPGALALKICPDILGYAAKNVDIIAVTGTNGKTTSARIIERALQNAGRSVCANRSGANLMPGITAELIMNKSLFGSTRCESAVIECDEAACRLVLGRGRAFCSLQIFFAISSTATVRWRIRATASQPACAIRPRR